MTYLKGAQDAVRKFHEAMPPLQYMIKQNGPGIPDGELMDIKLRLIEEEYFELQEAFKKRIPFTYLYKHVDVIEVADALADLIYVILGMAISCGIDMEKVFEVVHENNMTKTNGYLREDGKWMKPDDWIPPDIKGAIYGH